MQTADRKLGMSRPTGFMMHWLQFKAKSNKRNALICVSKSRFPLNFWVLSVPYSLFYLDFSNVILFWFFCFLSPPPPSLALVTTPTTDRTFKASTIVLGASKIDIFFTIHDFQ
jgi:hypothetical protein